MLAADEERARLLQEVDSESDGERAGELHEQLAAIDAHAAPARAAAILAGLGFDHTAQLLPIVVFSGRLAHARRLGRGALFRARSVAARRADRPHLDLEASLWLAEFLRRYRKTLLLVSHDRQFLDEVVDHILHLSERKLTLYSGGYEVYLRTRRETLAHQQALAARQEAERKHLQAFVDRFRAKASKARQAQSRVKALAKLQPISLAADEPPIRFTFPDVKEFAPPLITIDHASVGYIPGKPVLQGLNLRLDPDDRIALLGANGNGKSTFARLLAGRGGSWLDDSSLQVPTIATPYVPGQEGCLP